MKVLITGVAGFIGFSCANKFINKNIQVVGIDNFDSYYSTRLKKKRVQILKKNKNFKFYKVDIRSKRELNKIKKIDFSYVFHFAAQPGVRYSLINPKKYFDTNVEGFMNVAEIVNKKKLKKFMYASSSSVYGEQKKFPTSEHAKLNSKNPYGLSKIINEKLGQVYSQEFNFQFIGLRFFTVYGEWGRPDMFIIKLLNSIRKRKIFYLNNDGNHYRDFTYIKDITKACYSLFKYKTKQKHIIFNICAGQKVNIKKLTSSIIKKYPNTKIKKIPANRADVYQTFGNNKKIVKELKIRKFTKIDQGLKKTINWFKISKVYKLI
tara:strand:+ start:34 stop:993 length:960 start_codon:yes stop_codon:yes gene_type:complete